MNLVFKRTAIAILVTLGATACTGHRHSNNDNTETSQKQSTANHLAMPSETVKSEAPAKSSDTTKPEAPAKPEYNFESNKLTSDNEEWRVIQLEKGAVFSSLNNVDGVGDYLAGGSGIINLNKLSSDRLGIFSGKTTDNDYIVDNKTQPDGIAYIFKNQPYSSYGILYDINANINTYKFGLIQTQPLITAGENFYIENGHIVYKSNTLASNLPEGGITYRGDIFAKISTKDNFTSKEQHQIKQDGTVVLEAYLNPNNNNKAMAKGQLNSDTLGEIKLLNTEISNSQVFGKTAYKDNVGQYNARFGGSDFNDMVGEAELSFYNTILAKEEEFNNAPVVNGQKVIGYEAIFGGTKQ